MLRVALKSTLHNPNILYQGFRLKYYQKKDCTHIHTHTERQQQQKVPFIAPGVFKVVFIIFHLLWWLWGVVLIQSVSKLNTAFTKGTSSSPRSSPLKYPYSNPSIKAYYSPLILQPHPLLTDQMHRSLMPTFQQRQFSH